MVSAVYNGDDYTSGTNGYANVVTDVEATTTTVSDVDTVIEWGQTPHLTAHVADAAGQVRGEVELVVEGKTSTSQGLSGGQADLGMDLDAGVHTAYVRYLPAAGWAASQSAPFQLTVLPAPSSISGVASPGTVTYPDSPTLTFDATWVSVSGGIGNSYPQVELYDGDTLVTDARIDEDAFTVPAGTFTAGTHHLHAHVVGNDRTASSDSAEVDLVVEPADSDFTLAPDPAVVGQPHTVHLSVSHGSAGVTFTVTRISDGVVVDAISLGDHGRLVHLHATGLGGHRPGLDRSERHRDVRRRQLRAVHQAADRDRAEGDRGRAGPHLGQPWPGLRDRAAGPARHPHGDAGPAGPDRHRRASAERHPGRRLDPRRRHLRQHREHHVRAGRSQLRRRRAHVAVQRRRPLRGRTAPTPSTPWSCPRTAPRSAWTRWWPPSAPVGS